MEFYSLKFSKDPPESKESLNPSGPLSQRDIIGKKGAEISVSRHLINTFLNPCDYMYNLFYLHE